MDLCSILPLKNIKFTSKRFDKNMDYGQVFEFFEKLTLQFAEVCIAGGLPTFLTGKTTNFGDVDIYVNIAFLDEETTLKYELVTVSNEYVHLFDNKFKLYRTRISNKIIDVICYPFPNTGSTEMYAMRIIDSFDMEICRNSLYFDIFLKKYFIIETPLTKPIKSENPPSHERKIKYECRKNNDFCKLFQPYTLQLLACIVLVKHS